MGLFRNIISTLLWPVTTKRPSERLRELIRIVDNESPEVQREFVRLAASVDLPTFFSNLHDKVSEYESCLIRARAKVHSMDKQDR